MKTADLIGPALDWAVAKCEGHKVEPLPGLSVYSSASWSMYSTDWSQGGPIIEREGIGFYMGNRSKWWAQPPGEPWTHDGPTPLIAAMRCYVASKLGDEVDVPEELVC